MTPEILQGDQGYRLGKLGMAHILGHANSFMGRLLPNIRKACESESEVLATKERYLLQHWQELLGYEAALLARWVATAHPSNVSLAFSCILMTGTFAFSVNTMTEFQLGWAGWLYSASLAVAVPCAIEHFLQNVRHNAVRQMLISGALVTVLSTALLFGMVRGEILAHALNASSAALIDSANGGEQMNGSNIHRIFERFRLAFGLGALAFDLVAGILLNAYLESRRAFDFGALRRVQKEALRIEKELLRVKRSRCELLSRPANIEARFWEGIDRGINDSRIEARRRFVA